MVHGGGELEYAHNRVDATAVFEKSTSRVMEGAIVLWFLGV